MARSSSRRGFINWLIRRRTRALYFTTCMPTSGGARRCFCSALFIASSSPPDVNPGLDQIDTKRRYHNGQGPLLNRLKVVLSLITRDSDYQLEQAKAAEAVAGKQNIDLEIFYADSNSITQSSQLLDAIRKYKSKLSAILVEPAGGTEFPQVGKAAVSAGIAWVVLNRDASSLMDLRRNFQVPAFAVSSDHKEVGRIQAQQLAALV